MLPDYRKSCVLRLYDLDERLLVTAQVYGLTVAEARERPDVPVDVAARHGVLAKVSRLSWAHSFPSCPDADPALRTKDNYRPLVRGRSTWLVDDGSWRGL